MNVSPNANKNDATKCFYYYNLIKSNSVQKNGLKKKNKIQQDTTNPHSLDTRVRDNGILQITIL